MRIRPSLIVGSAGMFVGLCLVLAYWACGGPSPEPSDHPRWLMELAKNPAGQLVLNIWVLLCMPALLVAWSTETWGWTFWLIACAVQAAIYFVVFLFLGELYLSLKAR
jgi:hypothetical protein